MYLKPEILFLGVFNVAIFVILSHINALCIDIL